MTVPDLERGQAGLAVDDPHLQRDLQRGLQVGDPVKDEHCKGLMKSTCRRRRRSTLCGALRVTMARRASSFCPMSLLSMRSPPVR